MRYIEVRVMISEDHQSIIEEVAEVIKDGIYDGNENLDENVITDVTYEIKDLEQ